MADFVQEFRKYILKSPLLFGVLVILLIRGTYMAKFQPQSAYVNNAIEKNKTEYNEILNKVKGKWNRETEKILKDIENKVKMQEEELAEYLGMEMMGEISHEECWKMKKKNANFENLRLKYELIKEQKEYVEENTKQRYFVYENGWNSFFGGQNLDMLLFLLISCSVPFVYCRDYENDMHRLLRLTKHGNRRYFWVKCGTSCFFSAFVVVTFWMEDYFVAKGKYGLNQGSAPIQSLSLFKDCQWHVSIQEMEVIALLLSCMGALYYTVFLQLLSVIFKQVLYAVVVGVGAVMLPYYMLQREKLIKLPLISTFLSRWELLRGIRQKNGEWFTFSRTQFLLLCMGAAGMMVLFLATSNICYQRRKIPFRHFRLGILCIIASLLSVCTGCEKDTQLTERATYDQNTLGELFSYGNKIISIGDASYKIYTGESGDDLFADPFHSQLEWSEIHALNMQGKNLYFRQDRGEGEYEIVALNVENGETKVVYNNASSLDGMDYLDIKALTTNVVQEDKTNVHIASQWVEDYYYYQIENGKLTQINMKKHTEEVILDDISSEVNACSNGILFYVKDSDYNIWTYDILNHKNQLLSEDSVIYAKATDRGIFYQNGVGEVYFFDSYNKTNKKITDKLQGDLGWADERFIYFMKEDKIVRFDISSQEQEVCYRTDKTITSMAGVEDGYLYLKVIDEKQEQKDVVVCKNEFLENICD